VKSRVGGEKGNLREGGEEGKKYTTKGKHNIEYFTDVSKNLTICM